MARRDRHLACAILALALFDDARSAGAFCRSRSGAGQPDPGVCPATGASLAWSERCTGYSIDPRGLPADLALEDFRALVLSAAQAWQTASCDVSTGAPPAFAVSALPDGTLAVGYRPGQRNVNTVAFRDHWGDDALHRPGNVAITIVTYDPTTGHIFDADMELNLRGPTNPQGFVFSTAGDPHAADLQTVVTHEFGHLQGLAHSPDLDAVMWFSAGATYARRALTPDDAMGICAIYPPAPAAECDPLASGAPRAPAATPPGCDARPRGIGRDAAPAMLALSLALARAGITARRRRSREARDPRRA